MSEAIAAVAVAIIGFGQVFIMWKLERGAKKEDKKDNVEKAMQVMMRSLLRDRHADAMSKGYISSEDLGDFEDIYLAYHNLGGNGIGTAWKEDVEKLERKDKNE